MWIERDISEILEGNRDPVQIIRGPRQCGKSSLLLHLGKDFVELSLDDPAIRDIARRDPKALLDQYSDRKILLDEAQYAPELFPLIKRRTDLYRRSNSEKPETIIRVTGSNQILMDQHVKESLAGRASFFDLNTLSVHEILKASPGKPIQQIIFMGGWPQLHAHTSQDVRKYLDDYVNSYVERDVVLAAGIQKQREFLSFARLLAGRTGQILDQASLAKDVGVDSKTIKDWSSILERMGIVALVPPFHSNKSKRLIKSPRVYFIDTGLACRLQGWAVADPIFTSPQQGALFENLVFSELYKMNINGRLGWDIYHWRSRDQEEIDFLIQTSPGEYFFVEAKVSMQKLPEIGAFPEVRKVFGDRTPKVFQCVMAGDRVLDDNVPVSLLHETLANCVAPPR